MKLKVLVTGSNSQLASEFMNLDFEKKNWIFLGSNELDITNKKDVVSVVTNKVPKFIINCAAYTNVEKAENEKKAAFLVNQKGVKNLLHACEKINAKLIHFSSDYIFDGLKSSPYIETDKPNPLNTYGASKLAGETEILNSNVKSVIIRTSWLYSVYGKNFFKTIIKSVSNSEINVINDQIGCPTNAKDLALATLKIINEIKYEWSVGDIFNFSNKGSCSWYEFAFEICKLARLNKKLSKINSGQYISNVKRPKFTVMDKSKFENTFDFQINHWKFSLNEIFRKELSII